MLNFPKRLIQFWHDKTCLPPVYQKIITSNKQLHPDYEFLYLEDKAIYALIEKHFNPCLLALYQNNQIPASRSDIARLIAIYEYGGVYLNTSLLLKTTLNTLLENKQTDLILLKRDDTQEEPPPVWNGVIIATPQSTFIKACIEQITLNLLTGRFNQDVLSATGYKVLNTVLSQNNGYQLTKLSFKTLENSLFENIQNAYRQSWLAPQAQGIFNESVLKELQQKY